MSVATVRVLGRVLLWGEVQQQQNGLEQRDFAADASCLFVCLLRENSWCGDPYNMSVDISRDEKLILVQNGGLCEDLMSVNKIVRR